MYGIFMESWVMFKLYGGSGFLTMLYIASLIWLVFRERNKTVRILFLYFPLFLLFLFFFPVFRKVYVRLTASGNTQYRMLWLLPMGMTVSYVGCRLAVLLPMRGRALTFKRFFDRILAPLAIAVLIALCGSLVYASPYMSRAENAYHLPQEALDVCEEVTQGLEDGHRVRAALPDDLVHFARQYDTDIILAFGRDIVAYGYYNEVYDKMVRPEIIQMEELAEALAEAEVDVLVLKKEKPVEGEPADYGWGCYAETEHYRVYRKK